MGNNSSKEVIKRILGYLPMTAEMYFLLRQQERPLQTAFNIKELERQIPKILSQAEEIGTQFQAPEKKKVFLFASLHYWIEHAALMGATLAIQGHDVTIGFLPYSDWRDAGNTFDVRQQNLYAKKVLNGLSPLMKNVSFMRKAPQYRQMSEDIKEAVKTVSENDVQYTLRNEEVDYDSDLYKLRYDRNIHAARAAVGYFESNRPDIVIIPNGTIQEMGVVYQVAKIMGLEVTTYEFSDKRDHMWLAQNDEVMRQNTEALWEARRYIPLSDAELNQITSLFSARQNATLWENFSRLWQGNASEGGEAIREKLGLDDRPIVLLPTNVLGDSLALGRNVFTNSMSEWISRTLQYFLGMPAVQLVIRIHPGELITEGRAMTDVVKSVAPVLPEHIHLIEPDEKVNTYDIMEIATFGLAYTTTVGLEMAMRGKPVIVVGDTHYRNRGFTYDPGTWRNYYRAIGRLLSEPESQWISEEQVKLAWTYAYSFFFEYPLPYPWHLVKMWGDFHDRPMSRVFSEKHWPRYANTFAYLTGQPMDWSEILNHRELKGRK
ncbi:MAG: hypothetical protein K8R40_04475 [Anaerolineaceae bacterium]|nr:hypothetical protein [Anaerolineaceae bacterium]